MPTANPDIWKPNPGPQEEALKRVEFEVLYGGARGGGKTDAGLVWLTEYVDHPRFRALVIRKNADDLSDWVDRATRMYSGLGATVAYRPAEIRFPSGALIKTGHLKDDQAYTKYQGHEYHRMLIEELTQIPDEKRYLQLIASCRSTVPELRPQIFATTNPGGIGHMWVKERFIDPAPTNTPYQDPISQRKRIFIPAKVDDNPVLTTADPGYMMFLDGLRASDEELWKAWRHGRWDVFAGQVFREWNPDKHISAEFDFSLDSCKKILCHDWGYNDTATFYWLAYAPENKFGVARVWVYRELAANMKSPDEWGKDVNYFTSREQVEFMVLPHDCFSKLGGKESIASSYKRIIRNPDGNPVPLKRGRTLEKDARKNRKAVTHTFLSDAADGRPYLIVHPNCRYLIKTLPGLVYSDTNPEDVNTDGDDHGYDALSLGLVSKSHAIPKGQGLRTAQAVSTSDMLFQDRGNGQLSGHTDIFEAMKNYRPKRGNAEF